MQVAALRSVRLLASLFGAGAFVAATAIAPTASASSLGIDGNTNKPIAGVGHRCGDCHSGGTAPTVAFAGPTTLNAGQTGTYTFTVTGGVRAGASVAVTPDSNDGQANVVALIPGAKMSQKFNEVVQTGPATPTGGKVAFGFSFVAPQYGGTVKLWGAGLAANNNGGTSGDADQLTTMTVTIVGPPPGGGTDAGAKDAGFVPTDGGSTPGSDGGTVPGSDGGTVPGKDGGKVSADGSTDEGPDGIPANGEGSCAVGTVGASSTDAGALSAALFTMVGLVAAGSARRRRK
jgi:hypothetical protein